MKKRIIFTALGLEFLMASASFATVMVPDHTGTAKPLSQIPDIMRHVTGKGKDGQPLTLPKHSLVLVTEQKNELLWVQKLILLQLTEFTNFLPIKLSQQTLHMANGNRQEEFIRLPYRN